MKVCKPFLTMFLCCGLCLGFSLIGCGGNGDSGGGGNGTNDFAVDFPDPSLEGVIRAAINKPSGDIMASDLESLDSLSAFGASYITDISGLEYCVNLKNLFLSKHKISDISALSGLLNLTNLGFGRNEISDISALSGLLNLTILDLSENEISDISALSGLLNLTTLDLSENEISDINVLSDHLSLTRLLLAFNNISDIEALVLNLGLGSGDYVELPGNPLSTASCDFYIPELERRGVIVDHECP